MLSEPRHLPLWQVLPVRAWWQLRHLVGLHTPVWTVNIDLDERTHMVRSINRRWECGVCEVPMKENR